MWAFSTEEKLNWGDQFVRDDVEPLNAVLPGLRYTPPDERTRRTIAPLTARVREQGVKAARPGPKLEGQGLGQLKLALLNEIPGRYWWEVTIFGTQAPDTGNAAFLAHYATEAQKDRFFAPLLEGEIFSCYSMTEPQGRSEPIRFTTRAWCGAEGPAPDALAGDQGDQFLALRFPVGS